MKAKKLIVKLFLLVITILLLGWCKMFDNKPTLTKVQQDNVVKRISRYYEFEQITFKQFKKDSNTGSLLLTIELNGSENMRTTIIFDDMRDFNDSSSEIGLSPISHFESIRREKELSIISVNITKLNIKYLEE